MKKASVSLLVINPSMSLEELSSKLGRAPSSGSHSKGDAENLAEVLWSETIWRFDSDAQENHAGAEPARAFGGSIPCGRVEAGSAARPCDVSVDIALFFDTVNVSSTISPRE